MRVLRDRAKEFNQNSEQPVGKSEYKKVPYSHRLSSTAQTSAGFSPWAQNSVLKKTEMTKEYLQTSFRQEPPREHPLGGEHGSHQLKGDSRRTGYLGIVFSSSHNHTVKEVRRPKYWLCGLDDFIEALKCIVCIKL